MRPRRAAPRDALAAAFLLAAPAALTAQAGTRLTPQPRVAAMEEEDLRRVPILPLLVVAAPTLFRDLPLPAGSPPPGNYREALTAEERAACLRRPRVWPASPPNSRTSIHRDMVTGALCRVTLPPAPPPAQVAWLLDNRVLCPFTDSAQAATTPLPVRGLAPPAVAAIEVVEDSILLASMSCERPMLRAIRITTKQGARP